MDALNASLNASVRHTYAYARAAVATCWWKHGNSAAGSDNGYGWLRMTAVNSNRLGKAELRVFAQCGSGSTPRESALFLAGASPEEMMENKYVRSVGMVPYDWLG
ncbi:MAG: hypothetical protein IPL52_11570 [Flavobacteriales bacterium]|nr:hypothetical protein [Flavobacteriales bacterium]